MLKKSRRLLLREENLKSRAALRLRDLLRYNLKTVHAYLLKEAFQQLWDYKLPAWAVLTSLISLASLSTTYISSPDLARPRLLVFVFPVQSPAVSAFEPAYS